MTTSKQDGHLVLCQEWTEYERGWGCRPDGCSIHLSEEDHKAFCQAYWDRMPKGVQVPDEYSAESGAPYIAIISDELYDQLQKSERHGIWIFKHGVVRKASQDEILARHLPVK